MDLTTLTRAKAILSGGVGTIPADAMLNALIAAASDLACQYCSRTFQRNVVSNLVLNGTGTSRIMLPQNPVISLTGPVIVDGYSYTAAPSLQSGGVNSAAQGYAYDKKILYMLGGLLFHRGFQNVLIPALTTGYTTKETQPIPNVAPATIIPRQGLMVDSFGSPMSTSGFAFADFGVIFTATGAALVAVSTAPAAGQYNFSNGVYTFNQVTDNGKQVTMSYDFVPASVEQAVVETIGAKIANAKNVGVKSVTMGGESVNYSDMGLTNSARQMLQPYAWVVSP